MSEPVTVGASAPDFTLKDQFGQETSLRDLRAERAVLLVFYPFAFSGICTGELCSVRDDLTRSATTGCRRSRSPATRCSS